ncbi:hypothetical protein BG011_006485 [Mortierella polycephala]|uniref:Uncharacterized protein n=1 Tax=Mortierella polycephala TaxID=41804 RepID=A0A9P6TZH6_9FUNG|nr:hypothetical protein BG011_006485 [Mortierella polycephala]
MSMGSSGTMDQQGYPPQMPSQIPPQGPPMQSEAKPKAGARAKRNRMEHNPTDKRRIMVKDSIQDMPTNNTIRRHSTSNILRQHSNLI